MKRAIPERMMGLVLVISATACWASSGIFIRRIMELSGIGAVGLAFWRDLTTALVLGAGLLLFQPSALRIRKHDLPWLFGIGAISIGTFHVLWNLSVQLNGVGVATIVQSNAPIFVTLLALIVFAEKLTTRKIAALCLSIIGTVLIVDLKAIGSAGFSLRGIAIGVASAIGYGTFSIFGKKLRADYSPWTILFYAFAIASLVLLPLQLLRPSAFPLPAGIEFAGLILLPTILGFAMYSTALRFLPAGVAAITATSEVPFAALTAFIFLSERMSSLQLIGGLLVIVGVILIAPPRSKRSREAALSQP